MQSVFGGEMRYIIVGLAWATVNTLIILFFMGASKNRPNMEDEDLIAPFEASDRPIIKRERTWRTR